MAARVFVGILVLPLLLVGCIGDDGATDAGTLVNQSTLPNMTAPDGRTLAAFNETNQTESGVGGVDHHHDLWSGRSRVLVFERKAMMDPFPGSQNRAFATFRPDQGSIIFEGTGSVEFTISNPERHACEPLITFGGYFYCTDYLGEGRPAAPAVADPTGGPAGLKLRYKHASTVEWIDAGDLQWGVPLPIEIRDPRETDMPHATSSVWQFQVISPNAHDISLKFTAKAEMVRAEGDIPLWPGHPLFYTEEKPHRLVVDNVPAKACDSGLTASGCVLVADAAPVIPDKLISYGTRTLFVWANVTKVYNTNPASAPVAWFLYHNNATGKTNITNPFDMETYGIDQRELHWVLPVEDGSMDSPYADGSRWSFDLGASFRTPEPPICPPDAVPCRFACYGGCADWAAEYTLTIIASSVELPASAYHMYCLDPFDHCPEEGAQQQRRLASEGARRYVIEQA